MIKQLSAAALALSLVLPAGLSAAPTSFKGYSFEASVLKANGRKYREFNEAGKIMLKVRPNEEYTISVRNPLPVRAGVAVTIDGLNSIDGQRTSPRKARKWIIGPHETLTVSGWQTGKKTLRKFFFTAPEDAYVEWRGKKEGKPLAKNMGVIGIAWFWNAAELDRVLHPPKPFEDEVSFDKLRHMKKAENAPAAPSAAAESRAGTGMGQEQAHQVREVEFNGDAGMFAVRDVLKIYYEFADEDDGPSPFVTEEDEDDGGRFAPVIGK